MMYVKLTVHSSREYNSIKCEHNLNFLFLLRKFLVTFASLYLDLNFIRTRWNLTDADHVIRECKIIITKYEGRETDLEKPVGTLCRKLHKKSKYSSRNSRYPETYAPPVHIIKLWTAYQSMCQQRTIPSC